MLRHMTTAGVTGVPAPPAASSVGSPCPVAMPAAMTALLSVAREVF